MKITRLTFTLGLLLLVSGLILGSACVEPVRPYVLGAECDNFVLARVGEVDITLLDLLEKPQTFSLIQEGLITNEIIRQEAARRGVDVDMDFIQEQIDNMIAGYGTIDNFLEQVGSAMPSTLVLDDVRDYFVMQELKNQILNHEWETTRTPIPETEIMYHWSESETMYKQVLSNEMGIDPEEVTLEIARERMKEDIKQAWIGENSLTFFLDLRLAVDYEFYLFDALNGREHVVVPEIEDEHEVEEEPVVLTPEERAALEAEGTHMPIEELIPGNN